MAAIPVSSFRLTDHDWKKLRRLIDWEGKKGTYIFPKSQVNATSVLRALIERECVRLDDEEARVAAELSKKKAPPSLLDGLGVAVAKKRKVKK